MARTQRNRRQFEWSRAVGFGAGLPQTGFAIGAVDVLAAVREEFGAAYLRGATVMAVKGFIRPFVPGNARLTGVAGLRVANYADFENLTANQTPGGPTGSGADWMAYWPYDLEMAGTFGSPTLPATWNVGGSQWAVDVQSSRRLEEPGYTLGLFWYHTPVAGAAPEDVTNVDYHLSVGFKLA